MAGDTDALKRAAAGRALESVRDGMVLGLGTGSTIRFFSIFWGSACVRAS